jgi:hypothetical protein
MDIGCSGIIAYYLMLGKDPPGPEPGPILESRQFNGSDGEFMDINYIILNLQEFIILGKLMRLVKMIKVLKAH